MIIAGLTGGIGHGKTTFASLLAASCASTTHYESWEIIAEVACALRSENVSHPDPNDIDAINQWLYVLPDIVIRNVHARLKFDDIRVTPQRLLKHPDHYDKLFEYLTLMAAQPVLTSIDITIQTKDALRPLLQWLGGYLVIKVGAGIWYDEILRRVTHLRSSGYELVTIGGVRYPGDAERLRNAGGVIMEIQRPSLPSKDAGDLTERERSSIDADGIITNNGSISDLAACAKEVYKDLRLHQLRPLYTAIKA